MGIRPATNAAILDRTLRRLRRAGRLDELGEMLAVLAGTSARLVDAACTPDSKAPAYAQAACLRVHTAVLSELSGRIAPIPSNEDDPWERIARELEVTNIEDGVEAPAWDQAEVALAQNPAAWPEVD